MNQQLELNFDGPAIEPEDVPRLGRQLEAVRALMADGRWRTLAEIQESVGGSEAGVSARLRDLRKPKFGGLTVARKRDEYGVYWYRIPQEEVRMAA
mgnify:CR=1 FL=1